MANGLIYGWICMTVTNEETFWCKDNNLTDTSHGVLLQYPLSHCDSEVRRLQPELFFVCVCVCLTLCV